MQGNHTFTFHFPSGNAQTWRPIWIVIEAINGESANLISSGTTPASNEECCSLIRASKFTDCLHQPSQFLFWDVAWDTFRNFGNIANAKEWSLRSILPLPTRDITKEHREIRELPTS